MVDLVGVVPELLEEARLGLLGLLDHLGVHGVAEDHAALVHSFPLTCRRCR